MTEKLKPCDFCGNIQTLAFSFHAAHDKKHRYGCYDGAIYCRNCYSYGPRVRSEDLEISSSDNMKERMRRAAIELWNRRVDT